MPFSRLQLEPHARDLGGGFMVRRLLPSAPRPSVGPFLFFDHFGPIEQHPQDNHDVRPHPHIGLSTVTYLFEGAQVHRDSTGVVQRIEPGAINWMIAGRGIVHSERAPDDLRGIVRRSHGLQLWCALPAEFEDCDPSFEHTPAERLPELEVGGARVRVLVGGMFDTISPVRTLSPTLYVDIVLKAGDAFPLPPAEPERALYGVDAPFQLDGHIIEPYRMVVLAEGEEPMISAGNDARVVLIGGEPLGPRHIWWNFVSSRKERILAAADDWEAQRFPKVPGDQAEFIPLPDRRPTL